MNIDLLMTDDFEAGLISDGNLVKKVAGVVLDTGTGLLTLEYVDMDYEELNIPVQNGFFSVLKNNRHVHIGAVKNGNIAQAYQIPFMILNDPYNTDRSVFAEKSDNPLLAFEFFIRSASNGQPVHRADLGDEDESGCILGDSVPSSLQFAPHLAQQRSLEAAPTAQPTLTHGPSVPGLGGGGGGGGSVRRNTQKRPPKKPPDDTNRTD